MNNEFLYMSIDILHGRYFSNEQKCRLIDHSSYLINLSWFLTELKW